MDESGGRLSNVVDPVDGLTVQAVVELKNKPTMWHLAKKITLTSGQTDLKIEFPLPIVACNIMIEYSDFYENIQVKIPLVLAAS